MNAPFPLILAGWVMLLGGCEVQETPGGGGALPALPVDVANPVVREIVEWDEYTGRFEAVEHVDVRARVSGYLESVHFRDGQIVERGDLLFVIDPRPFEAALARTEAELKQAQAALSLAAVEVKRAERLRRGGATSQEDLDIRRSAFQEAKAGVAAGEARVQAAKLDLGFTEVHAPVDGRVSDRRVDVGNLVEGGGPQSTLLTTLVVLHPIYFVFDASEADFLKYVRLHRAGKRPSSRETPNPVYVKLIDEVNWARRGEMNFVDNALDPSSGTMRARAVFPNPDYFLVPGVFGRARLLGSGKYEALLIPERAILSDQSKKIVMTVNAADVVQANPVVLGAMVGGLRVVRSGIEANSRVVVNGVQRARPGAKVVPQPVDLSGPDLSDDPPPPES